MLNRFRRLVFSDIRPIFTDIVDLGCFDEVVCDGTGLFAPLMMSTHVPVDSTGDGYFFEVNGSKEFVLHADVKIFYCMLTAWRKAGSVGSLYEFIDARLMIDEVVFSVPEDCDDMFFQKDLQINGQAKIFAGLCEFFSPELDRQPDAVFEVFLNYCRTSVSSVVDGTRCNVHLPITTYAQSSDVVEVHRGHLEINGPPIADHTGCPGSPVCTSGVMCPACRSCCVVRCLVVGSAGDSYSGRSFPLLAVMLERAGVPSYFELYDYYEKTRVEWYGCVCMVFECGGYTEKHWAANMTKFTHVYDDTYEAGQTELSFLDSGTAKIMRKSRDPAHWHQPYYGGTETRFFSHLNSPVTHEVFVDGTDNCSNCLSVKRIASRFNSEAMARLFFSCLVVLDVEPCVAYPGREILHTIGRIDREIRGVGIFDFSLDKNLAIAGMRRAIEVGVERRIFGFYSDREVTYNGLRRGNYVRKKTVLRFHPTPGQIRTLTRGDCPIVSTDVVPYDHMAEGYYSCAGATWMMPTVYKGYAKPPLAVFTNDITVGTKLGADNVYTTESSGHHLGYENRGLANFVRYLGGEGGDPVEACSRYMYWYARKRRKRAATLL